jgi:hypothetical protein
MLLLHLYIPELEVCRGSLRLYEGGEGNDYRNHRSYSGEVAKYILQSIYGRMHRDSLCACNGIARCGCRGSIVVGFSKLDVAVSEVSKLSATLEHLSSPPLRSPTPNPGISNTRVSSGMRPNNGEFQESHHL